MSPKKQKKPRTLAEIAAEFQRGMDDIDRCARCNKPRMTASVSFGGGEFKAITSAKCECADGGVRRNP